MTGRRSARDKLRAAQIDPASEPHRADRVPAGDPVKAALTAPPPDDERIDVLVACLGCGTGRQMAPSHA